MFMMFTMMMMIAAMELIPFTVFCDGDSYTPISWRTTQVWLDGRRLKLTAIAFNRFNYQQSLSQGLQLLSIYGTNYQARIHEKADVIYDNAPWLGRRKTWCCSKRCCWWQSSLRFGNGRGRLQPEVTDWRNCCLPSTAETTSACACTTQSSCTWGGRCPPRDSLSIRHNSPWTDPQKRNLNTTSLRLFFVYYAKMQRSIR